MAEQCNRQTHRLRVSTGLVWLWWLWLFSTNVHAQPFVMVKPMSMVWLAESREQGKPIVDINDATFSLVRDALPTIGVTTHFVGVAQSQQLLLKEPRSCTGNLMPLPERKSWGLFSQLPQVVFPGLRLFVRRDSALNREIVQALATQQSLSIERLLQSSQRFQIGFAHGRSYGARLDALLQNPDFSYKLWQRRASDTAGGVLLMLTKRRIDAVLEYPNVVAHYMLQQGDTDPLESYAVVESPDVLYGHLVCADSAQGQALMRQINKVLPQLVKQQAYLDAHLRWFPADMHASIIQLYNRTYGTQFGVKVATPKQTTSR